MGSLRELDNVEPTNDFKKAGLEVSVVDGVPTFINHNFDKENLKKAYRKDIFINLLYMPDPLDKTQTPTRLKQKWKS